MIVTFDKEQDVIKLPPSFVWKVHRQLTTTGLQPMTHMKFEDFETGLYKWKDGAYHLFELRQGSIRVMAYCVIDNKN